MTTIEITELEISIAISILIIGVIVLIMFFIATYLYIYLDSKLHKNYHKGYSEGNNDNLKYYKALKEISDSFNLLYNDLKGTNKVELYVETLELITNLRDIIKKYSEK